MEISWEQRRGQIKHQLYTLALLTDMDKGVLGEMFKALNEVEPIVRCKDCKHFGEADSEEPEYHECKYFSDWSTVHYVLENDYCSCAEKMDEVEK